MAYRRVFITFLRGIAIGAALPASSATALLGSQNRAGIEWTPCGNNTVPRECGRFEVPLDYNDPTAGVASLALARINATKTPRIGTLFVNPGGPGGSGVTFVLNDIILLMHQGSGGQYDIVSWDPRGAGNTSPKVQCFQSGAEEKAFWNGSIRGGFLEVRGSFSEAAERDWFYSHVKETDAALIRLGKQCNEKSQDILKYVGTASTVRDLVALHDHMEGTQEINYWGISQIWLAPRELLREQRVPFIILANLVLMGDLKVFPQRVGRVILDGIIDPWLWATRPFLEVGYVLLDSSEATFDAFALECANAGPSKCAIAQNGSTADSIRAWTFDLIASVYDNSTTASDPLITAGQLRAVIGAAMYRPKQWASLARKLAGFAATLNNSEANATSIQNIRSRIESSLEYTPLLNRRQDSTNTSDPTTDYANQAITCADAVDPGNTTTRDGFDAVVDITRRVTKIAGPYEGWIMGGMYCHHWPSRAVERFTGPFNHTLANKILVIGNLADPITPFVSAKRVADALGGSAVLIKQNGYGHTSLLSHSNCTAAVTTQYFTTGKAPLSSVVCDADDQLF